MTVDYLRSCYEVDARFCGPDGPVTRIRWYFTDAPSLPFHHAFGSRNWLTEGESGGPGEIDGAPRKWVNGAKVGSAIGDTWCGTREQWIAGELAPPDPPILTLADGTPACCLIGRQIAFGQGGQSQGYDRSAVSGNGGQRQGGRAVFPQLSVTGGQSQGGAVGVIHPGQGGQEQGGSGIGSGPIPAGQEQGGRGLALLLAALGQQQGGHQSLPPPANGGVMVWAYSGGFGGSSGGGTGQFLTFWIGIGTGCQIQGGSGAVSAQSIGGSSQGNSALTLVSGVGGELQGGPGTVMASAAGGSVQGGEGEFIVPQPLLSFFSGNTANAYATVFDVSNAAGLIGMFTVKNMGSTGPITWRQTVTDMFGTLTVGADQTLGFGQKATFSFDTGTPAAPYSRCILEVKDFTPGTHVGYQSFLCRVV